MKQLKYNHPSVPPKGIQLNKKYTLEDLQSEFELELIKTLFTPVNFKWTDLEKKSIKTKLDKVEEIVIEGE